MKKSGSGQRREKYLLFLAGCVLSLFLFLTVSAGIAPSIQWQKCLGGTGDEIGGRTIHQIPDGGYILTGETNSSFSGDVGAIQGDFDAWVMKLSQSGNLEWTRTYGGNDFEGGDAVIPTTDGGYFLTIQTFSNTSGDVGINHGNRDVWVVKINADGSINWSRCIGGTGNDVGNKGIRTMDGGYIFTGFTTSNASGDVGVNHGLPDAWAVKLTSSGFIEWVRCYGGSMEDVARHIRQTPDGGYILVGSTNSTDGDVSGNKGWNDIWVVKLNPAGSIEWQKCFGGSGNDVAANIILNSDGGYTIAGNTQSNTTGDVGVNHGNWDMWMVKLNPAGSIEWQKCYGGSGTEKGGGISQTPDGGYIFASSTNSNDGDVSGNHGGNDIWVVKLTADGTIDWQKCLGGSADESASGASIKPTPDGGYILSSDTTSGDGDVSGNHGGRDIWVVKLNPSGSPPVPNFNGIPTSGTAPLTVSFTDLSFNNPTGWAWYFGDEKFTAPWTLVNASAGWSARYWHSSVAMPDGSIVLMGGSAYLNDVWRSTDNGATWTLMNASAGWSPRNRHSSVAMPDGSILLMGGWNGECINDVWRSTDNGATWTLVNMSPGWTGRFGHSTVVMPDRSIVLMGGSDIGCDRRNDVWRSMDYGVTWTLMNGSAGWSGRYDTHSVAMPDGSIVLMGGFDSNPMPENDVWRSTDNGATWTLMNANAGWIGRWFHSIVAMPDGSIVLMGGQDGYGNNKNDIWRSTDNGATWTLVNASAGWSPRMGHSSVVMQDGSIVLMSGYGGNNDVWRFQPVGSSAQNPSHTYTTPGIYAVALQAHNANGYNSTRKTGYITVTGTSEPVIPITLPYFENYDSMAADTYPPGYLQYYSGHGWEYAETDSNQFYSAPTSFRMEGAESSSQEVGIPLNGSVQDLLTAEVMVMTDRAPGDGREGFFTDHRAGLASVGFLKPFPRENFGGVQFAYDPATHLYQILAGNDTALYAQNYTPNVWYNLRIQTNIATHTYSVWIDNVPFVTDVAYTGTSMPEILLLNADNGGSFTRVWYDDVRVDFSNAVMRISTPGFYWLSSDILNSTASPCIEISSSDVIFDGMGHVIDGTEDNGSPHMGDFTSGIETGIYVHSFSQLTNVTIRNVSVSEWRLGINVENADDVTIENVIARNTTYAGIWVIHTDNSTIRDVTAIHNAWDGIAGSWGNNNRIIGCDAFDNGGFGIGFDALSSGNIIADNTANENMAGFYFRRYYDDCSNFNFLMNNTAIGNSRAGVHIKDCHDNLIFNNYFNNTNNVEFEGSALLNQWNATPRAGPNIIGGPFIGGNFWGSPYGTGFSRLHADTDNDGFAEDAYIIATGNVDGLVLTSNISGRFQQPIANFSAFPLAGSRPLTVDFTDTSTGSPTGWAWYFGDENFTAPWTLVSASAGWSVRSGHNSVVMPDGSIVLMGGNSGNSGGILRTDVWRSTDNGATWTLMNASAGWTPRVLPSSVALRDGSIVLMGGYDGSDKNDVWRSTDNGATWTLVNASPGWPAREYHASVAMPDSSIVLMGGSNQGGYLNDVWRSADNGATWTLVNASAGWSPRNCHSSVAMPDGSIVLIGGGNSPSPFTDVWRSTDNGATWTLVNATAGWSARTYQSTVVMADGSIVLMGGIDSVPKNDWWRSIDNGATWTLVNGSTEWPARYGHVCVVVPDGTIVLTGGSDGANRNDVWRFMSAGSSMQNPSHTYTAPGTYPVVLQAYNAGGYNSTRKINYITVIPEATPGSEYVFVKEWGSHGGSIGQFNEPRALAVDRDGNIFVADCWNGRIQKFTSEGEFITQFGGFIVPGVATDAGGNVYAVDHFNNHIQKFTNNGNYLLTWGTSGTGDGQFDRPYALAINSSGIVYVTDTYNNRIQKFTNTGTYLGQWGSAGTGDGQFNFPVGITIDSDQNILVADENNNRIQKFTPDGTYLSKWGLFGSGNGEFYWPQYIAINSIGNILISDSANHRVQVFTSNGEFLAKFGSFGSGPGQFNGATGVAVDRQGYVYVADNNNHRIQKFRTSLTFTGSMFRANPQHTGVYSSVSNPTRHEKWNFTSLNSIGSSPAVLDGMLYFGSLDGRMYAVYANNGSEKWQFATGNYIYTSPAVTNGIVYFGSYNNKFYALNASAGTEIWNFTAGSASGVSCPLVNDGTVYIGSRDGNLYALDAFNGTEKWRFATPVYVESSPAILNGIIYIGAQKVHAIYANNGSEKWNFTTGGNVAASPAIDHGVVYIGSEDHNLYALYADNGTEKWHFISGNIIYTSAAVHNGMVYVGSEDHNIYALYANNGTEKWRFTTGDQIYTSSAAIANDVVYVGSYDNNIYALDIKTGAEKWRFTTGGDIYASPVISGGILYIGSMDGKLYALGGETPQQPAPTVTGITPATGINTATVSITNLTGTYFISGATVMLTPVNANPVHKGNLVDGTGGALLSEPRGVYVSGNYAYVASTGDNALEIVDVSNPGAPVHAGSLTHGSGGALLNTPRNIYVSGTYAYITSANSSALEIVNISNPAAPVHAGSLTHGSGGALLSDPRRIYISGNYAYVTSGGSNALEIADVSNPAAPVHAGSLINGSGGALLNTPRGVYVSGNYAYIASSGSNALEIVDVSNKAAPVHAGSLTDGTGGALLLDPRGIYVSGNFVYITSANSSTLEIVNVSNPAAPLHAGSLTHGSGGALLNFPSSIDVSGNYAYIASSGSNALEVVDVSNPGAPVHAGSLTHGSGGALLNNINTVFVSGTYAYVTSLNSNALEIVDIGTIAALNVNGVSPAQITCTLNLTGKSPGPYNVVVTNPDGQFCTLSSGFTVTGTTAPVLAFQPGSSIVSPGSTTTYMIMLNSAPDGLSGYNITVALDNTSIGEIVNVSYPSWASMPVNSSMPADRAWFKAVDLAGASGTQNITFCTIIVRGDAPGTTNITILPERVEDRAGGRYNVTAIPAQLTVSAVKPLPNPIGGYFPLPTDPNHDGKYEDLDGNGWIGFNDVVVIYNNMETLDTGAYGPVSFFDYDNNGWIGFNDVVRLYMMV